MLTATTQSVSPRASYAARKNGSEKREGAAATGRKTVMRYDHGRENMEQSAVNFSALPQRPDAAELTAGGRVFVTGAWTGMHSPAIFCFSKVLRNRNK
jgi:hypothetical protein